MFADKFTSTTDVGANALNPETRPSWHTAGMMSIMHKTAPDAEIVHYNVTNEDTKVQDEQFAQAIRDIIEKNKTLPDEKKIKTIVMGWGFYPNNPKYEEYINLCKEAVESGIFISSNNSHELYGISTMGADRDPKADVNSAESYRLCAFDNADNHKDIKKEYHDNLLYFPMQHLTIGHEDGESIQYDGNSAGVCWANSVGALYNDFVSIKPDLKPKDFMELLVETSDELKVDGVYCGRLLNASAAAEKLKNN